MPPYALTCGASDVRGRTGIQADLRTFAETGVEGASIVCTVRADGPEGPIAAQDVPASLVRAQLQAALAFRRPAVVKTGLLSSVPAIRTLASGLRGLGVPLVVDPVLVGARGEVLLRATSLHALVNELLPLAALVTPNLIEASLLSGQEVTNEVTAKVAALRIQTFGPRAVLILGGRGSSPCVVDALLDGRTWHRFSRPRLRIGDGAVGAGGMVAAAAAAFLARGETLPDAVEKALAYVSAALSALSVSEPV